MRIISGLFKSKKILQPEDIHTRPLKDLTKESIFNILNHSSKYQISFENSIVLDLFSGVGSFGIECISRGVKKAYFVENYNGVLPILKKNLSSLKTINNYEIIEKNIYTSDLFENFKTKFDIIFMDPPYKDKSLIEILSKIKIAKLLKNNGIIIIHRHKNQKDEFSTEYKIIDEKKYGISKIIFLTYLI